MNSERLTKIILGPVVAEKATRVASSLGQANGKRGGYACPRD